MFGDINNNKFGYPNVTIKEVAKKGKYSIKAGPFGSSLKKEYYVSNGYKIYGQEQVIADDAFYGDYYINQEKYDELISCKVEENDVLISLVGTYGKILIIPQGFEPGIINPRLMKISFDETLINTIYFKHYFSSETTVKMLNKSTHGGTMGILNTKIVSDLSILLPPKTLQDQFATIVEQIDKSKLTGGLYA